MRVKAIAFLAVFLLAALLSQSCCQIAKTTDAPKDNGEVRSSVRRLSMSSIRVATWNIEWLHETQSRGFPEYKKKSEKWPPRDDEDFAALAKVIGDLGLSVVMMQEVQGVDAEDDEDDPKIENVTSPPLDTIRAKLQGSWSYVVGTSGDDQRLAILYDDSAVRLDSVCEIDDEAFVRNPLVAYFTITQGAAAKNDFVCVNLHLKSGQDKTDVHDAEMKAVTDGIAELLKSGDVIPKGERDFILAGDLNANRFDNHEEEFWDLMEAADWDVLANDDTYPATRLSSRPPAQHDSKIDYIIISKWQGGLAGNEATQTVGAVHDDLLDTWSGFDFRASLSDHLPVSVTVGIGDDDD